MPTHRAPAVPAADPAAPDTRTAWTMVAACAVMVAMGFGSINNIAVFLVPLGAEFHWPRAELALAYAMATLGTGLGGVVMGHLADRLPIRRVALCGALAPALGYLLLARLDSLAELHGLHALMGLFGLGAIMAPLNSLAAQWMPRRPGVAIGVVSAGGAFGQGVLPFLARQLLDTLDWRAAYTVLGLLTLAVMLPLALCLRNPPRAAGAPAAAAPATVRRAGSPVWLLGWLCVAVLFCCVCMATPIVHVTALGADRGLGGSASAGLLAAMMVSGMLGRLGFGRLADRIGSLPSYAVASAGQTALALLFPQVPTAGGLYLLSIAFGLVFSGAMTAFILCAREYAPPSRVGLSIGVVMGFAWAGMALGGWQGGLFHDLCGDYGRSFVNASLGGVLNLLVLALLAHRTLARRPRLRTAAA